MIKAKVKNVSNMLTGLPNKPLKPNLGVLAPEYSYVASFPFKVISLG